MFVGRIRRVHYPYRPLFRGTHPACALTRFSGDEQNVACFCILLPTKGLTGARQAAPPCSKSHHANARCLVVCHRTQTQAPDAMCYGLRKVGGTKPLQPKPFLQEGARWWRWWRNIVGRRQRRWRERRTRRRRERRRRIQAERGRVAGRRAECAGQVSAHLVPCLEDLG